MHISNLSRRQDLDVLMQGGHVKMISFHGPPFHVGYGLYDYVYLVHIMYGLHICMVAIHINSYLIDCYR